MLVPELQELLNSLEFEESGSITINSCNWEDNNLSIVIKIRTGKEEIPEERWKITVNKIQKESIRNEDCYSIELYSEHCLLLKYNDIHTELYSNSIGKDHDKLIVDLIEEHYKEYNGWISVNEFLHSSTTNNFRDLFNFKIGLLARGPKTILEKYQLILKKNKKDSNILEMSHYRRQHGKLSILLIGNSYFIGEEFKFEHIDN